LGPWNLSPKLTRPHPSSLSYSPLQSLGQETRELKEGIPE
jgi:hypothetical protein